MAAADPTRSLTIATAAERPGAPTGTPHYTGRMKLRLAAVLCPAGPILVPVPKWSEPLRCWVTLQTGGKYIDGTPSFSRVKLDIL